MVLQYNDSAVHGVAKMLQCCGNGAAVVSCCNGISNDQVTKHPSKQQRVDRGSRQQTAGSRLLRRLQIAESLKFGIQMLTRAQFKLF
jgi:hypothetical protein